MTQESAKPVMRRGREEKEQHLLGRLEQKVEAVKTLKSLMERLTFDVTQQSLVEKLHDFYDEVKGKYPHLAEKLQQLTGLRQAIEGIQADLMNVYRTHGEEKIDALMKEAAVHGFDRMKIKDVEIVTAINDFQEEHEQYLVEIESLEEDQDLRFLTSLQYGIDHLVKKFQQIKAMKDDVIEVDTYCTDLLHVIPRDRDEFMRGIEDIEYSPLCVTIFMEAKTYEKFVGKDTSGVHMGRSPINIVKESGDEVDIAETVEHESIHAFVDEFLPPITSRDKYETDYWMKTLKIRVETLDELLAGDHNVGKSDDLTIQIPYFGTVANFIDSLHEEMIADLDRIEQLNIFADSSRETLLTTFTTAKSRSYQVMLALQELRKHAVHPLLKEKLQKLFEDIAWRLQKAASQMNHALLIGSELGSQMDVEALLVLLQPTQYYHLQRYLKHLHGKEAVKDTERRLEELYNPEWKKAA